MHAGYPNQLLYEIVEPGAGSCVYAGMKYSEYLALLSIMVRSLLLHHRGMARNLGSMLVCRHSSKRAQTLSAAEAGQRVEEKYMQEYEKRLDPFSEFKGKVKEGRQRSLPIADKVVYIFSHVLFGSRIARLAIVIYVALMHILTFSVLFTVTHSRTTMTRDWHCSRAAAAQALSIAQGPETTLP